MPGNLVAPNFALMTSLDMRSYSGVDIFTRNSTARTMPTFSTGEGIFEDLLFFLNNRESSSIVSAEGQFTVATFGSTWEMSINEDDRVTITSDVDFEITSTGTNDSLGFGASTVSASAVGSDYIATAPNDWVRGLVVLDDMSYRIDEVGGSSNTFNIPAIVPDVQDVTTFIRSSESDSDDLNSTSLQIIDSTNASAADLTWNLNNSGFVTCHYRTSEGDLTWDSTGIRDLLGFTGNETPVVDGVYSRLTASQYSDAVLFPSRPLQAYHSRLENVGQFRRKIGGGYASNHVGSYVTSIISFDLDARLDQKDDYQRFINRFLPLVGGGERINLYQDFGDSRRSLRIDQVKGNQLNYDLLYTSEENGERGRLRGSLVTVDYDLIYPNRLHRRVPVTIEIENL